MELIEQVKEICTRLAPHGWKDLLLEHGLNITAANLKEELLIELPSIKRNIKGFEDFSLEGKRGIEPGNPSRSLLYHAFASPNVKNKIDDSELELFPTIAEIDIIENYVYGINPPSITELQKRSNDKPMAITVFSSEYRPSLETVHKKHADKCFSRTGVSRIGTKEPLYVPKNRGFVPFDENKNIIRVLPAQFSVYIAVQEKGNKDIFGPMRFKEVEDKQLDFWVPIHKLFSGDECIKNLNLNVKLESYHVNEKLRRIHQILGDNSDWKDSDIKNSPFIFTDKIAEFSNTPEYGNGILIPHVHSKLVEPAEYKGKPLTFKVPPNSLFTPFSGAMSSSLYIPSEDHSRHAPEYVHIRHMLKDGEITNLNDKPNMTDIVKLGGYQALHYIDYTGDGWIKPICPELKNEFKNIFKDKDNYAYSLVTAPDFFPNTDQRELLEWWEDVVSKKKEWKDMAWYREPNTLSDQRLPANLTLQDLANTDLPLPFDKNDKTCTAIISLPIIGFRQETTREVSETSRHSYLPDAAAGEFAPGWDVARSSLKTPEKTEHLAVYGLGSPFPEDAKLCAALSTFWPAVAPDAARTFEEPYPTVSPLTDEEIGIIGNDSWDGVTGPRIIKVGNKEYAEYTRFTYGDHVEAALENKFSLSLTGLIDTTEYKSRVLSMVRVNDALKLTSLADRREWQVLSFQLITSHSEELEEAENETNSKLNGRIYRFYLIRIRAKVSTGDEPADHRKIRVPIIKSVLLFVDQDMVLLKKSETNEWEKVTNGLVNND
jgi:hypothetical protein